MNESELMCKKTICDRNFILENYFKTDRDENQTINRLKLDGVSEILNHLQKFLQV